MRNNLDVEKHKRRFIGLATLIFILVWIGHMLRLVYGWTLIIGGVSMPLSLSWFAFFVSVCMVVMGVFYLKK